MNSIHPSNREIPTFTSASLLKLKKDTLNFIQKAFMRRLLKSSKGKTTQHCMKYFWVELACKHNIKTSNKKIALLSLALLAIVITHVQAQKLSKNNIDEIVKAMTLEEKAQLLVGSRNEMFGGTGATVGATQALVPGAAGTTQGIDRLGITRAILSFETNGVSKV